MPAIVKRTAPSASTFRASCEEHPRFRGLAGSMRLALKQADGHNELFHRITPERETLASALRARKDK